MTPFREAPADILTERDASTRTGSLSNVSYNVSLALSDDPDADTFHSVSTVVFDAAVEGSETFINIAARSVDQYTLNGKSSWPPSTSLTARCSGCADCGREQTVSP